MTLFHTMIYYYVILSIGGQSDKWRPITITSQWVMMLLGTPIVMLQ